MTGTDTDPIAAALASYAPVDAIEAADVERLRVAVTAGEVRDRSSVLHVTGSALVVHEPSRRVLLRWHPRMQMWMQVGGHFDPDERDPWVVALREAAEETGLTDLRVIGSQEPLQIVIVPVPAHGDEPAHEHADFRYLLATDAPDAVAPESSAAQLRWLDLTDAMTEVVEPNLREFLRRVAARLG